MKDKINLNGVEFTVIATYHDDNTNKDFIMYTDESHNEKNQLNVYYGYYKEDNGVDIVTPIDNNDDMNVVKQILDEVINSGKEAN